MAKITITIEGDSEELKETLSKLINVAPAPLSSMPSDTQVQLSSTPTTDDRWTPALIERLWKRIKPKARRVLLECAREPEGISTAELQQRLNIAPKALGGINSSIGFAINYYRKYVDSTLDSHGPFVGDGSLRIKPAVIPIILQLNKSDPPDE